MPRVRSLSLIEKKTRVKRSDAIAGLRELSSRVEILRHRRAVAAESGSFLRQMQHGTAVPDVRSEIDSWGIFRWKRRLRFRAWCDLTAARAESTADGLGYELSRLEAKASEQMTAVRRLDERGRALRERISALGRLASAEREVREEDEYVR